MKRILTGFVLALCLVLPGVSQAVQLGSDACGGSGDLGANWTVQTGSEMPQQTGGICQAKTLNVVALALYTAVAWPNDQYAQIKVVTASTNTGRIDRVVLRGATGARTGYECGVAGPLGATATLTIFRLNAGAPTTLAGGTAIYTVASGDTLYCEIQGYSLVLKINGSTILTADDSASGSKIASGNAGVFVFAVATNLNTAQLDDWAGGDFISPSTCRGGLSLLGVGGC